VNLTQHNGAVPVLARRMMRVEMSKWPPGLIHARDNYLLEFQAFSSNSDIIDSESHYSPLWVRKWIDSNLEQALRMLRTSRHEGRRLLRPDWKGAVRKSVLNRKRRKKIRMIERWANRILAESGYDRKFAASARKKEML
jgi:hypothetical protein